MNRTAKPHAADISHDSLRIRLLLPFGYTKQMSVSSHSSFHKIFQISKVRTKQKRLLVMMDWRPKKRLRPSDAAKLQK
jgi:hypothetical protein